MRETIIDKLNNIRAGLASELQNAGRDEGLRIQHHIDRIDDVVRDLRGLDELIGQVKDRI